MYTRSLDWYLQFELCMRRIVCCLEGHSLVEGSMQCSNELQKYVRLYSKGDAVLLMNGQEVLISYFQSWSSVIFGLIKYVKHQKDKMVFHYHFM